MTTTRQGPKVVTSNRGHKEQQNNITKMKTKYYTICRQAKGQEWADVNNVLSNTTSKAQAKKEAKEWAASLRQTVSVWRITKEDNGRGVVATFPEWIGQAESPVYLRDMEQTTADICGNWAE